MEHIEQWNQQLANSRPEDVLAWAVQTFGDGVAFASSLGLEDQVLTHTAAKHSPSLRIFTLDTGRLFPETYTLIQKTEERYNMRVQVMFPDTSDVEGMVAEDGVNLFYKSRELRKKCCGVRKIIPLRRALAGLNAWVCGLRRDQAVTRQEIKIIEWDEANQLVKINPLAQWSEAEVKSYIREYDVPYNPLHDAGFPSIGCACCTRAVGPGEDARAGRWWWEEPEQKECGLHVIDGKLQRRKS